MLLGRFWNSEDNVDFFYIKNAKNRLSGNASDL